MHPTILFLGGHRNGLRYPTDRSWREHGRLHGISFLITGKECATFRPDEPPPTTAPVYEVERYIWYDFGALDVAFMILDKLDAREAVSLYLRGEPIL